MRSGQASPGSVARHRRHKRRLEERPSSSDAADGAECYELRDYHSDDDASARDNSVDDDSDSDATLNDDDDVTVRQVGSEARAREAPPYKGERARPLAALLRCSTAAALIRKSRNSCAKRNALGLGTSAAFHSPREGSPRPVPVGSGGRRAGARD